MIKTEILSVHSPKWANKDSTAIDCWVRTNTLQQEVPFTASPYDSESHGREIFERCFAGEFGEIAPLELSNLPEQSLPQIELPTEYQRIERFFLEANRENSRKSFRSVVIVWGALLDNIIDEMLKVEELRIKNAGGVVSKPPHDLNSRIKRALDTTLITQEEANRCHHIRKIRNATAHEWDLSLETKGVLSSLRALYEADHSELLVFHNDLEFLLQQVYSSSCAMLVMKFISRSSGITK